LFDRSNFWNVRRDRLFDRHLQRCVSHSAPAARAEHLHESDAGFNFNQPNLAPIHLNARADFVERGVDAFFKSCCY